MPLWNKIYEKLFGGFEDLASTAAEDEAEEDELANVPKELKTKQGYLKDGIYKITADNLKIQKLNCVDNEIEDLGSELSEESYDYDSDDVEK